MAEVVKNATDVFSRFVRESVQTNGMPLALKDRMRRQD